MGPWAFAKVDICYNHEERGAGRRGSEVPAGAAGYEDMRYVAGHACSFDGPSGLHHTSTNTQHKTETGQMA